jgi:putative transposase
MKYRFMEEYRKTVRLKRTGKVLEVSRGGYYAWKEREPSRGEEANEQLLEHIREAYRGSRNT